MAARALVLAATFVLLTYNAPAAGQPAFDKAAGLSSLLASVVGTSDADCYPDAACAPADWENASRAIVLLLLGNSRGARFCTGALLNTPHLWAAAAAAGVQPSTYILSATHCRLFDTAEDAGSYYTAVFQHQAGSCSAGSAGAGTTVNSTDGGSSSGISIGEATAAAAAPKRRARRLLGAADSGSGGGAPPIVPSSAVLEAPPVLPARGTGTPMYLQGLHVAWQDEDTDVLLLRLDGAVPAEYHAAYLGWNASSWAPVPTPAGTLSHPRGDLAKYSFSDGGLQRARFVPVPEFGGAGGGAGSGGGAEATHYKLSWTQGGTDTGSSGAPLIDAATQQVLGVLTGGEAATCNNMDLFGSLHAAWLRGLWQVLSPDGPTAVTSMPPAAQRQEQADASGTLPELVVSPAALVLQEGSTAGEELRVRLSAPLAAGMQLSVAVSVQLEQPQPLLQHGSDSAGTAGMTSAEPQLAGIALSHTSLQFDSSNWAEEQVVVVGPGPADQLAQPPATFAILLSVAAAGSVTSAGGVGARSTAAGVAPAIPVAVTGGGVPLLVSVPVRRLDGQVAAGDTQEQPILISATGSLDLAASGRLLLPPPAGSLVPAVPAVQAAAALLLGQALGALAAATGRPGLGMIRYYSLSPSGAVSLDVSACSTQAPLQVAVFNAGVAVWVSTERHCAGRSAGATAADADAGGCRGVSGVGGCSGFQDLLLPGLDGGPPYILAVLPLPDAAAGESRNPSSSSVGNTGAALIPVPTSISYDLRVASTARLPTFAHVSLSGS